MARHEYPPLSESQREQLRAFEPSHDQSVDYWPSRVSLADGSEQDYVYLAQADRWFELWGIWPADDRGKRTIPLESVVAIRESTKRLPTRLANKLYAAGESGMGYVVFTIVLRDGRQLPVVTGNAVDFPPLPDSVGTGDIVDVLPHVGREKATHDLSVDYAWCLFGS